MKFPKDDKTYKWTSHIKGKMIFYRLSPQVVKNIMRSPRRVEEGIAPNTTAAMKRHDTSKRKEELWLMYRKENQNLGNKIIMISTWRYPGVSKSGKKIPIPDNIREELGL